MDPSDCSGVLQYVDHADFPASAPINHPHILKDEEYPQSINISQIRLCDSIATLLHHLEAKQPGALRDFFDMNVKEFKSTRVSCHRCLHSLSIVRQGNTVIAGHYNDYPEEGGILQWETLCKSSIGNDGKWTTIWGAQRAYSKPSVEGFVTTGFFNINRPSFENHNPNDKKEAAEVGAQLASAIWHNQPWDESDKPTFNFEIKRE